jgi:hypothetical protein
MTAVKPEYGPRLFVVLICAIAMLTRLPAITGSATLATGSNHGSAVFSPVKAAMETPVPLQICALPLGISLWTFSHSGI